MLGIRKTTAILIAVKSLMEAELYDLNENLIARTLDALYLRQSQDCLLIFLCWRLCQRATKSDC